MYVICIFSTIYPHPLQLLSLYNGDLLFRTRKESMFIAHWEFTYRGASLFEMWRETQGDSTVEWFLYKSSSIFGKMKLIQWLNFHATLLSLLQESFITKERSQILSLLLDATFYDSFGNSSRYVSRYVHFWFIMKRKWASWMNIKLGTFICRTDMDSYSW